MRNAAEVHQEVERMRKGDTMTDQERKIGYMRLRLGFAKHDLKIVAQRMKATTIDDPQMVAEIKSIHTQALSLLQNIQVKK
jgi:hypothetical protein